MIRFAYCILLVSVLIAGGAARIGGEELTAEQKTLNLQSLDQVWSTIRDRHFDTTFGGNNWNAAREEFRPKVEAASSMSEFRKLMTEMLSRLKVSHCGIISKESYEGLGGGSRSGKGVTGIQVRIIGSQVVISAVEESSPAYALGVRAGWVITKVGGEETSDILTRVGKAFEAERTRLFYSVRAIGSRLKGTTGDSISVAFLDGSNNQIVKAIRLVEPTGKEVRFSSLPPIDLTIKRRSLNGGIEYFGFSAFMDPVTLMAAYDSTLRQCTEAAGLIIDVRGNPGGIGLVGVGMAGSLVKDTGKYLGTMYMRGATLKFVLNQRQPSYYGPVAVLADEMSASTSEIFAGGLKDIGRVRVFGTHTIGAALPALIDALPNGDAFIHPMANYISFAGEALEVNGVEPDVPTPLSREELLQGHDQALDAAVAWLKTQKE